MSKHIDNIRNSVRCEKCRRILAKIDDDGTIHIKPQKGADIIAGKDSKIMFVCESIVYMTTANRADERLRSGSVKIISEKNSLISYSMVCGNKTFIN